MSTSTGSLFSSQLGVNSSGAYDRDQDDHSLRSFMKSKFKNNKSYSARSVGSSICGSDLDSFASSINSCPTVLGEKCGKKSIRKSHSVKSLLKKAVRKVSGKSTSNKNVLKHHHEAATKSELSPPSTQNSRSLSISSDLTASMSFEESDECVIESPMTCSSPLRSSSRFLQSSPRSVLSLPTLVEGAALEIIEPLPFESKRKSYSLCSTECESSDDGHQQNLSCGFKRSKIEQVAHRLQVLGDCHNPVVMERFPDYKAYVEAHMNEFFKSLTISKTTERFSGTE